MAITRTQIAKQLLAQGGRTGFQGGGADMGREVGPVTGRSPGPVGGGGRNPMAQFQQIQPGIKSPSLSEDAREALQEQRKRAIGEITPSTKLSNKIIGGLASVISPIPFGGLIYKNYVDARAMGFKPKTLPTPEIIRDDDDSENTLIANQKFTPYQTDVIEDVVDDKREDELSEILLALRQRDSGGGARAFAAEGGIMDLEQARQGYKLGKLVKKIGRSLKKIGKSPIGKAALAAAAFVPFGDRRSLFDTIRETDFIQNMEKKDMFGLAAAAGLTAAPFIFDDGESEEDEYAKFLASQGLEGESLNIPGLRAKPYDTLARAFVAEGGKPEPVAKKTLPLLDMDGKEMDLREEGGFVPIGRMEKADDVPARLSKNEFVFTADAVRNAGQGDVDKGSEVMYNMMKNLEAGGEVSEESQGLEGARKMFQTSQRLEEVL